MKLRFIWFISLICAKCCYAQQKSISEDEKNTLKIYLITCEADSKSVLTMFGHCALRIQDLNQNRDDVFFFGDLDQLEKNSMLYGLLHPLSSHYKMVPHQAFELSYRMRGQKTSEQLLLLDSTAKQKVVIEIGVLTKSQHKPVLYSPFDHNCTTQIFDLINNALGKKLGNPSIGISRRKLLNTYWNDSPELELLLDVTFGAYLDIPLTERDQIFLPSILKSHLEANGLTPATTDQPTNRDKIHRFNKRILLASAIACALILLVTVFESHNRIHYKILSDIIIVSIGLAGLLLVFFWAQFGYLGMNWNLNILWLTPTNLLIRYTNRGRYFCIAGYICALLLLLWEVLPQHLNVSFAPVLLALSARYFYLHNYYTTRHFGTLLRPDE